MLYFFFLKIQFLKNSLFNQYPSETTASLRYMMFGADKLVLLMFKFEEK